MAKWGIYGYADVDTGNIVYVGVDRNMNTKDSRKNNHLKPSKASYSEINKALSNKPSQFDYIVLIESVINKQLAQFLELIMIHHYRPKFNVKKPVHEKCVLCKK